MHQDGQPEQGQRAVRQQQAHQRSPFVTWGDSQPDAAAAVLSAVSRAHVSTCSLVRQCRTRPAQTNFVLPLRLAAGGVLVAPFSLMFA